MPYPISIAIISKNEQANLRRCLASAAGLAEEIVIVDSGSTDATAEVAAEFGARFVHQDWLGYTDQKNLCNSFCTQPWILALDCDEELSPELQQGIAAFFESGDSAIYDAAWMARCVWFLGRWIRHGDWYPDKKVRLFRREKGQWQGHDSSQVHERLVVQGPHTTLRGDLYHYSFTGMRHYLDKHLSYTEVFADHEKAGGRGWSLVDAVFRPWWRFFRAYFIKAGFLDGFPGLWIAIATAFFTFMRYSRAYEGQVAQKPRD
ncbi:glycosyltransferase involved in cell wall biosynthesis [Prosthecobacter fusiformis]|uniref:Glycosyltransferase involved in cell wall biosynthesis n=1 Tax=Prosthecobacter fusiformis TaxID=48464 RepID=A0A4V3FE26_9BACT|nr:glycosyltransferase family 2 protein [Prosthecobacter fusiformis]TDU64160.1 glycosyltransferase involved in cell wall biosynthesis [Prosthecobacter fusiformis]